MDSKQASPMFDLGIASALIVGPVLALVVHSYAQPLLLPAVIAGMVAQGVLPLSSPVSRRRMAYIAGLLGFNLLGFGMLM